MKRYHYCYRGDFVYKFQIIESDIKKAPPWSESENDPPLSPRDAMIIGKKTIETLFPEIDNEFIKFHSCTLTTPSPSCWYYLIRFIIPNEDPFADDASFDIPVLFNGQSVIPEKIKEENLLKI